MSERETSQSIDQAASDWAARLDREPLTSEEENAFNAWLNGDPRRKGALLRAQAVSMMSESARALGPRFDPAIFEAPKPQMFAGMSRRRVLSWTGAAAACASLVVLGVSMPAAGAVVTTGRGEVRMVPLEDGSAVTLNTGSSVRIEYDDSRRVVTLLAGEAYFSVAADAKRPFLAEVDGYSLRAGQASFRIRKLDNAPVDILVNQGWVDVIAASGSNARSLRIEANMRLVLAGPGDPSEHLQSVPPEAVSRELVWREGKIAFEGETLEQAADAFARYSDTRIVIGDPELAREPVTGLFAANDPAGFSRAIARVFDARVDQDGDTLILSRSAAAP